MADFDVHRTERQAHWDAVARQMDGWTGWGGSYHRRLAQVYRFLVPPGRRVLEIGCARGDLLASLKPADGVGADFSPAMIERARLRHPELRYVTADVHDLSELDGTFDFILLSDLVNDLWDIQVVFAQLARLSHSRTRLIINTYSRLWELPLALAQRLNLAKPRLNQNWLTPEDIGNLLHLSGFEVIRHWPEVAWPLPVPLLSGLFNRWLVRFWPFRLLAMTNFILARPRPASGAEMRAPRVSVIVPARNEAGNIQDIFARTPE
ncbi:MAG: class I SAM-dependent methyltransferase, partial [Nevskiales bacterium]